MTENSGHRSYDELFIGGHWRKPANQLPPPPAPHSDPLTRPGQGSVQCSGQQPNPCTYTSTPGPPAIYTPQSGEVVAPDGTRFALSNSTNLGDDGWRQMLAPAG